jgi:hypothetical protein
VDASQNVGIGTASPAQKLHISGTGDTRLQVESTSSGAGVIYLNGSTAGFAGYNTIQSRNSSTVQWAIGGSGDQNTLPFYTNGSERMRIDSSGNLLVGTTTSRGRITCSYASGDIFVAVASSTNTGYLYDSASTSVSNFAYMIKNGANVGSISCTTAATAYNTSSDYRLKHDVQPMTGALAKVAALKPVTYKWNVDDSESQGFIAHELAEVVPECVTGEKDAVNEDGSIKPQGIDTSFLVATLTAAIKEQQALITQLQADVAALKGASA